MCIKILILQQFIYFYKAKMEVYKSATVLILLYGSFILNVTHGFPLQIDSDKELKISPSEIEAEMSQSVFNSDDVNSKEMSNKERIAKFERDGWTKTTLQDYEDNFENKVLALTQQKDKKKANFNEEIIKLESTHERIEAEFALMENIRKALELNKQNELEKGIQFESAFEVEAKFQKEVDERLVKNKNLEHQDDSKHSFEEIDSNAFKSAHEFEELMRESLSNAVLPGEVYE